MNNERTYVSAPTKDHRGKTFIQIEFETPGKPPIISHLGTPFVVEGPSLDWQVFHRYLDSWEVAFTHATGIPSVRLHKPSEIDGPSSDDRKIDEEYLIFEALVFERPDITTLDDAAVFSA